MWISRYIIGHFKISDMASDVITESDDLLHQLSAELGLPSLLDATSYPDTQVSRTKQSSIAARSVPYTQVSRCWICWWAGQSQLATWCAIATTICPFQDCMDLEGFGSMESVDGLGGGDVSGLGVEELSSCGRLEDQIMQDLASSPDQPNHPAIFPGRHIRGVAVKQAQKTYLVTDHAARSNGRSKDSQNYSSRGRGRL